MLSRVFGYVILRLPLGHLNHCSDLDKLFYQKMVKIEIENGYQTKDQVKRQHE
jgi:hypothetical protein